MSSSRMRESCFRMVPRDIRANFLSYGLMLTIAYLLLMIQDYPTGEGGQKSSPWRKTWSPRHLRTTMTGVHHRLRIETWQMTENQDATSRGTMSVGCEWILWQMPLRKRSLGWPSDVLVT